MMLVPAIDEPGEMETMADERRCKFLVGRRPSSAILSHSGESAARRHLWRCAHVVQPCYDSLLSIPLIILKMHRLLGKHEFSI